jgi:hypothetical protein
MNVPNYLFLKPLEDFFLNTNQKVIELKFFESFLDELGQIPAGSSFGKDGVWENGNTYTLRDYILEEFERIYDKVVLDIDVILISLSDKGKFIKYVETALKYILTNFNSFLKEYPEIKGKIENDLKKHLLRKYNIQISLKKTKFISDSSFNYKHSESVLRRLYQLSISNSLIFDMENVDESTFIEVFSKKDTKLILQFNCSSVLMVGYLDAISKLFNSLNEKSISDSKKFITKRGEVLTYTNYQTNRNRFKKDVDLKKLLKNIDYFIESQVIKY